MSDPAPAAPRTLSLRIHGVKSSLTLRASEEAIQAIRTHSQLKREREAAAAGAGGDVDAAASQARTQYRFSPWHHDSNP